MSFLDGNGLAGIGRQGAAQMNLLAASARQTSLSVEARESASLSVADGRLTMTVNREARLEFENREDALVSLTVQARKLAGADKVKEAKVLPEEDLTRELENTDADSERRLLLLLLAHLMKREGKDEFKSLVGEIDQESRDLAADLEAILAEAGRKEEAVRAALSKAEAAQAEAEMETQRQELSLRDTMGATVQVSSETRVAVTLLDQTVVQIDLGREVSQAEADQMMDSSLTVEEFLSKVEGKIVVADPLVLDLEGDGIARGAMSHGFDLNADGVMDRVESLGADDAFLVLDRNGNGTVDDGREVFGDQHGAADGFEELRKYDGNEDGVIDAADEVYGDLRLWADFDGDGVRGEGELLSLEEKGVTEIRLPGKGEAKHGVERYASYVRNGREGLTADLWLRYEATA